MKKIPKLLLVAAMGLLTSASSCEKKVKPVFEQIDSCKECGFESQSFLKAEKVKLKLNSETNEWNIYGGKFSASLPCKFPKELLIENNEIIIDGKLTDVPNRSLVTARICIEKIY
jgi:hypothetical protein